MRAAPSSRPWPRSYQVQLDAATANPYGTGVRTLVIALATAGGVGYAPVAPGTWGALVAVPFLPWLAGLRARAPVCYGALLAGVAAVGVWAAGRAEVVFGGKDHSRIVIDEVAGQLVAGAFVPGTWSAAGLAFVLFRIFDVVKPYPASVFDRRVPGGLGVVGDDLVAGAYAGLVAWVVLRLA
jgi:phosphatidylglycerophosphatase A